MSKIIGVHTPTLIKNLAINGAFDYWQRVESATQTINTASSQAAYAADMFQYQSGGATVKNYSVVQSSNAPTLAQSGFQSNLSYLFTMITGIASPAAGDFVVPSVYKMEGLDYEKIHSKTVTFGFWVQASVAGTYSFALQNAASNRSYVTTFSVSGSNTWQFVTLPITLDNTGTWVFTNSAALQVFIGAVSGTTYQTSSLGAWQAGNFLTASSGTNWQATTGATLNIAQFSIVEGPLGFSATGFSRAAETVQQELAMCQRYYEKTYDIGVALGTNTTTNGFRLIALSTTEFYGSAQFFKVSKRTDPSMTGWGRTGGQGSYFDENISAPNGNFNFVFFGINCFYLNTGTSFTAGHVLTGHWAADAGL